MTEKNLWSKLALIVVLVGLAAWQLWPLTDGFNFSNPRLKPGIDLGGGHRLVFEIDTTGLEPYELNDLPERVMQVLKKRVDPQGQRNLVWRPIGRNRLEIQMPQVPEDRKKLRNEYDAARAAIRDTNITELNIRASLDLPPEQREAAFQQMAESYPSREEYFDKLVSAHEDYQRLSAEYEELTAETAEPPATRPAGEEGETATQPAEAAETQPVDAQAAHDLAVRVDAALAQRNEAIEELLATNLDERVLGDLLDLGRGDETREKGIAEMKEQHPDLVPLIDRMIEAHDAYAQDKGFLDDPSDLIRLLRGSGVLEFRILATRSSDNPNMLDSSNPAYNEPVEKYLSNLSRFGPRRQPGDNYAWFPVENPEEERWSDPGTGFVTADYAGKTYVLAHATEDMGLLENMDQSWSLRSAMPTRDSLGRPAVSFRLGGNGPELFGALTSNNLERPLCIFLDGKAISSANIKSAIYDSGQITGKFTPEYVSELINTLEAGSLPARLKDIPLQQQSIGPTLGETNRSRGLNAILIAFLITIVFMFVYYGYNGLVADIALLINIIITLGVMSFLQATFTLPGIAGLVLTLGMAVDANVLIYERIREELSRGVSVRMAVKLGYQKAFSAILDSNVTTILTAVILGSLGSEEIKGFGLVLGIGLCTSMFTALFVTRIFFIIMVPNSLNTEETRRAWLGTGILVVAAGLILGIGYLSHSPEDFEESRLLGLGKFLAWVAATAAALMVALWAFRTAYQGIGHAKANRLPMLRLFSQPKIDWMKKYRVFWTVSAVIIALGLLFEASVDPTDYLDIEFIGGTNVQVEMNDEHQDMQDVELRRYVFDRDKDPQDATHAVGWLNHAGALLDEANVTAAGENRYLVQTGGALTTAQMEALLLPELEPHLSREGIEQADNGVFVNIKPSEEEDVPTPDLARVTELVRKSADYARSAAGKLRGTRVQSVGEGEVGEDEQARTAFDIVTPETNRILVSEALLAVMGDVLHIKRAIDADLVTTDVAPEGMFPIPMDANDLSEVIGEGEGKSVRDFKGGVALVFEDLSPPQTPQAIEARLREMRLQPDFEDISWRDKAEVIGLTTVEGDNPLDKNARYTRVAIVVVDPSRPYTEGADNTVWRSEVAEKELELAQAAFASTSSFTQVTQFAPQVAEEATIKAVIAILLSLLAIAGYLWVRFGSVEFGLAGIIALYHDVAITLALVMACHHLHDTVIGRFLLLEDFRIDLAMIAAFLTIVGYSINDSIVIFDRIRENRGRLATISGPLINDSLNQTLSRTIITSLTTFMVVTVMYFAGGSGIHGFAFAMMVGTISGTYSTIAIATPMLHHPKAIWVVTTILAALTLIGLITAIPFKWVQTTMIVIVVILAGLALYRQFAGMKETPRRQPATA